MKFMDLTAKRVHNYSGPEGARVKVPPLFFVIIICVFCVLDFLLGYKA